MRDLRTMSCFPRIRLLKKLASTGKSRNEIQKYGGYAYEAAPTRVSTHDDWSSGQAVSVDSLITYPSIRLQQITLSILATNATCSVWPFFALLLRCK